MTMNKISPEPQMGQREWGLLLALAVLWGGSFFFFKVLVTELPPFTVVLGRVGLAAILLNLWLALRHDRLPVSPRLWGAFILLGLLNNVIPFSLIVFGETRISSGLASILNATTPLFTVLVAHVLTHTEKLTWAKIAGVGIGFAGVAVLIGPGALAGWGTADLSGQAACLLAALCYAFAGIYGRRFKDLPPIKVATGQITGSTLVLIPLVAVVDRPWSLPVPSAAAWGALAGIAVLCTVLAYILYFRILATAGATNLLLVTFLIPVSAILLGTLALGEALQARHFAGMALIGGGLACIDGRLIRALRGRSEDRQIGIGKHTPTGPHLLRSRIGAQKPAGKPAGRTSSRGNGP
jgi:drug/metabolite transporter (DMT)-like permease